MIQMEQRFSRYANRIVPSAIRGLATMAKAADCISFGPGEPDSSLFPVAEIRDSLARILARPERTRTALQYGPSEGDPALRDRICAYMRAKGVACDRQNILLTNGAQQALDLVTELFVEPGASVLVQCPTYPGALQIFLAHGAWVRSLETAVPAAHERPALIYAMSNFHNPTGATLSLAQRHDLVARARELDTILIEDDPYEVLRYEGEALPPLLAVDAGTRSIEQARTIYLGTFSKAIAPGFRVGWLVAPSAVVAKLALMKQSEDLQAGSLAQACLLDLFDDVLDSHADRLREAYRIRRDTMLSALQSELGNHASWITPQGGFFIWLNLNADVDAHALLSRAAAAGVTYVPGSAFQPDERATASLRVSFSAAPVDRMEEGVRRLAKVLRDNEVRTEARAAR